MGKLSPGGEPQRALRVAMRARRVWRPNPVVDPHPTSQRQCLPDHDDDVGPQTDPAPASQRGLLPTMIQALIPAL